MMILILILTLFNTIGMLFILVNKFNESFLIVKRDVYDTLLDYWGEYHDEDGNELRHELAGGVGVDTGFFREALYDEEEEPEDE